MIKTSIVIAIFTVISTLSMGQLINNQSVLYDYDARGNRVKRYVYLNKKGDDNKLLTEEYGVRLFPNPTLGQAQLDLSEYASDSCTVQMQVIDSRSQLIRQEVIESGVIQTDIESSTLESGTYFIYLQSDCREPLALKLIIQ